MYERSKRTQALDETLGLGHEHPHFDDDWYKQLCEKYTHVNPGTKPNLHNEEGTAVVGGAFQRKGLENALSELATVLGVTALMICAFFKFEDLSTDLSALVESASAESPGS